MQDIAERIGVSRTTVSNVLHGNTKKVSQETIRRISEILDEEGYVPDRMPRVFSDKATKIIGLVLGFEVAHGIHALQDSFVGEFLATVQEESEKRGYYVMLINGEDIHKIEAIASRWNIDGLIMLGFPEERYRALNRLLNKYMVLVDTYPKAGYDYVNVGIDDYSGGEQIGKYLRKCGHNHALFMAETKVNSDYYRWLGFKHGMEEGGGFCSKSRYVVIPENQSKRTEFYDKMLPDMLRAGALAFSADLIAIEAINFFHDRGIKVPEQISVTGFDDCRYVNLFRPRLTTIHQDVREKAEFSVKMLIDMIRGLPIDKKNYMRPVSLVVRDSVKSVESVK
jgi:LacI family transcriptional regulator